MLSDCPLLGLFSALPEQMQLPALKAQHKQKSVSSSVQTAWVTFLQHYILESASEAPNPELITSQEMLLFAASQGCYLLTTCNGCSGGCRSSVCMDPCILSSAFKVLLPSSFDLQRS